MKTWGYCWLLEPHDQRGHGERRRGYPHCQIGVATLGDITREEITDLVIPEGDEDGNSPYLRGNPFARARDHGEQAVTMREQGDDDGDVVMALAAELTNGLLGYRFDLSECHISDVPLAYRRLASLLWATNTPSVGRGGDFAEWVERSQQEYDPPEDTTSDAEVDPSQFDDDAGPDWVQPDPVEVGYRFPAGYEQ